MIKKISLNLLGVLVGLLLLGSLWSVAIGIGWVIATICKFLFVSVPYSAFVVSWLCGGIIVGFILILAWVVGRDIIKNYTKN